MDRAQSYYYSLSHQANSMSQKRVGTDRGRNGGLLGGAGGRSSRFSA